MKNIFQNIKGTRPRTNVFDLSHEAKLSCNMGQLIPMYLEEIVPGDQFKVNSEIMLRLAPMLAPVMHRVNVYTHYFFVPNRLTWNEWESFITGGEAGDEAPTFPQISVNDAKKAYFAKGRVPDYFGIPTMDSTTVTDSTTISALPFRAYQMIYNEYFRDQNVEGKVPFSIGGTVETDDYNKLTTIRKRAWEKDYFTSALPWAQRGGDVSLPISSELQITPDDYIVPARALYSAGGAGGPGNLETAASGNVNVNDGTATEVKLLNLKTTPFDIDNTSVTINELRTSVKLQQWLEKNARGGSRYIEQIFSHFGEKSSDARLQRPEYLGGGKSPVVISEVLNTAGVTGDNVQGEMAGHGISVGKTNTFNKKFEEHGYILGIMSVLPRTAYQNGIERTFSKFDKFDYFWPEFAHLGEQEILQQEIQYKVDATSGTGADTFGYQSRYAEYKYKQSKVAGDFRDNLAFWHMGRIFDPSAGAVALNSTFVKSDPTHRIFAVDDPDIHKLYVQIFNDVKAKRPMPYFATPQL